MAFELKARDVSGRVAQAIGRFLSSEGLTLKVTGLVQPVVDVHEYSWRQYDVANEAADLTGAAGTLVELADLEVPGDEEWDVFAVCFEGTTAATSLIVQPPFNHYWWTELDTAKRVKLLGYLATAGTKWYATATGDPGDGSRDVRIVYRSRPAR